MVKGAYTLASYPGYNDQAFWVDFTRDTLVLVFWAHPTVSPTPQMPGIVSVSDNLQYLAIPQTSDNALSSRHYGAICRCENLKELVYYKHSDQGPTLHPDMSEREYKDYLHSDEMDVSLLVEEGTLDKDEPMTGRTIYPPTMEQRLASFLLRSVPGALDKRNADVFQSEIKYLSKAEFYQRYKA